MLQYVIRCTFHRNLHATAAAAAATTTTNNDNKAGKQKKKAKCTSSVSQIFLRQPSVDVGHDVIRMLFIG